MKEFIECLLDGFIRNSTVYTDLEKERNDFDAECGKKQRKIESLQKDLKFKEKEKQELVLSGQTVIEEKTETIKNLKTEIERLENKLKEKEIERRKVAGRIGGLKTKIVNRNKRIKELEDTNNFLRNHRRAPTIEELKDYQLRRKKCEVS